MWQREIDSLSYQPETIRHRHNGWDRSKVRRGKYSQHVTNKVIKGVTAHSS
jgi:hypothetical protein